VTDKESLKQEAEEIGTDQLKEKFQMFFRIYNMCYWFYTILTFSIIASSEVRHQILVETFLIKKSNIGIYLIAHFSLLIG